MLLFGEARGEQRGPADLAVNIQELFWPESPPRRAAVFSQGVVSGRPSQFDLVEHAFYRARWCLDLNISFMGKMLGQEEERCNCWEELGSPDEMLGHEE